MKIIEKFFNLNNKKREELIERELISNLEKAWQEMEKVEHLLCKYKEGVSANSVELYKSIADSAKSIEVLANNAYTKSCYKD